MAENCTVIFAKGADIHSYAVESVLKIIGGNPVVLNTYRLGSGESASIEYRESGTVFRLGNFEGPLESVRSSWNRRFSKMFVLPPNLHPADVDFVRDNLRATLTGILCLLDDRFPVNPITAARIHSNKLKQLQVARSAGFRVPKTLVSNNFDDIQSFMASVGNVCVKPYDTHGWKTDNGLVQAFTVRLGKEDTFDREAFEISPHIYQEYIHKKAEYRVVLFGGFVTCVQIDSSALKDQSRVDWRSSPDYLFAISPYELPEAVVASLRQVLAKLGLRFGVFDLAETADGEFVFFEVNEQGQWLWQEFHNPECPILQPFSEYLLQADDGYCWDPARSSNECSAESICRAVDEDPRFREQDAGGSPDYVVHVSDERRAAIGA